MSTKVYVIILATAFGIFILSAIINGILESRSIIYAERISPELLTAINVFYFILFLAIGFTIMPLMLKFFIWGQIKIGHGELSIIKWLVTNENAVVYGFWGFCLLGLLIALPLSIKDGFFK